MSRLKHVLAALALSAVFCVPSHADSTQLNALATQLAGKPVTVQCFPPGGVYQAYTWPATKDGITWTYDTDIHMAGDECGALQNVLTPGHRTEHWLRTFRGSDQVGNALLTLTHEATHIALDSQDEGLVECTAYENVYNAARLLPLGWKDRNAVTLAAQQAHEGFSVSEYRSVC